MCIWVWYTYVGACGVSHAGGYVALALHQGLDGPSQIQVNGRTIAQSSSMFVPLVADLTYACMSFSCAHWAAPPEFAAMFPRNTWPINLCGTGMHFWGVSGCLK